MENLENKIARRKYIWHQIDSYLVTFFFSLIVQMLFSPYKTNDISDLRFYWMVLNALIPVILIQGKSIYNFVKFLRK
ncbi:hypothetical protein [Pedobacter sp. R20-19]|uniref:hypothetical protein n=1 Tax=Pedobacter sp. R20-19 TaxID=1270196 RepID=UPI0004938582|nr:hypothetical protein [Pedobacter sp. R20-19]